VLVGMRKAEEMLYLSERVGAAEAARIGLINRVVPSGELAAATDGVCQRLLDMSEKGLRLTKSGLRATKELLLASMSAGAEANVAAVASPELHAAFDAFTEGREMSWRSLRPAFAHDGEVRHA
jgi:enoyl-CoA hydratase/carnithine racemase